MIERKVVVPPGCGAKRQIVAVGGQEPPTSARASRGARPSSPARNVHLARVDRPEQPQQQVEEMDADVGGDAARALGDALPRHVVPGAARRDVGERHLMPSIRGRQALLERDHRRMQPQLQHGVDAPPGFALDLLERVEVPRVDDQRLLADRVGAERAAPSGCARRAGSSANRR